MTIPSSYNYGPAADAFTYLLVLPNEPPSERLTTPAAVMQAWLRNQRDADRLLLVMALSGALRDMLDAVDLPPGSEARLEWIEERARIIRDRTPEGW